MGSQTRKLRSKGPVTPVAFPAHPNQRSAKRRARNQARAKELRLLEPERGAWALFAEVTAYCDAAYQTIIWGQSVAVGEPGVARLETSA